MFNFKKIKYDRYTYKYLSTSVHLKDEHGWRIASHACRFLSNFYGYAYESKDEDRRLVVTGRVAICGGAVLSLERGEQPNDFDIYLPSYGTHVQVVESIRYDLQRKFPHYKYEVVSGSNEEYPIDVRSLYTITVIDPNCGLAFDVCKLQLVFYDNNYTALNEFIVKTFDLNCCMLALYVHQYDWEIASVVFYGGPEWPPPALVVTNNQRLSSYRVEKYMVKFPGVPLVGPHGL